MANFTYPTEEDFKQFVVILREGKYTVAKYLPPINRNWFITVMDCIKYVHATSGYEGELTIQQMSARILYKVTKKHELGDGNKRTAVISVVLFCIMNDWYITQPSKLKDLAKRIAKTKGRVNEDIIKKRIAKTLEMIMQYKKI